MPLKACGRCGGFHPIGYKCTKGKEYNGGQERKLRNLNAWHKKSTEIRERANYLCEVCRDKGRYVYNGIEVHHIRKLKDYPEGLLDNYNLVCLCSDCHKKADSNEMPISYLEELARKREGK